MTINNFVIPIAFLAIGALGELIALRHPTPGERAGTVAGVLLAAGAGFFVPVAWAEPAIIGFAIARGGSIGGLSISRIIDKIRVWRVR
jgi:hypothetical protein